MLDPEALARIKSLELRARVVVEGFRSGLHRSPFHGFSVEFSEYRAYAPGDDLRHLDWRVLARSDRPFIKKFEDETNLRCLLLVDRSHSMRFGTGALTKEGYAATLAATLAYFLHGQGDAAGVLTFAEAIEEYVPPRHRPGHLRRVMLALERPATGRRTDLEEPLRRAAEMQRRRGLFVLVSDLLAPIDRLAERLGALRARGHEVVVFRVLDPAELDLGIERAARFIDLETGREAFIDPGMARERYRERFGEHERALRRLCDDRGIALHTMTTDRPVESALHEFLGSRLVASGTPSRGRGGAGGNRGRGGGR